MQRSKTLLLSFIIIIQFILLGCQSEMKLDSDVSDDGSVGSSGDASVNINGPYLAASLGVNNLVTLTFSKSVQDSSGGALTSSDFTISLSGGVATIGATQVLTRVSDTVYTLYLDLQGTTNGLEVITISGKDNTVYDLTGLELIPIPQTVTLKDFVWPTYSVLLEVDNSATLTFSEAVISISQSDLVKSDLDLSIVGGSATLGGNWTLTKVSGGQYSINLDLQGTPDGAEVVHVNMTDLTVFDTGYNLVISSDETVTISDQLNPTFVMAVSSGNIVTVTFSEAITDESNGDLLLSDFDISVVGGVATLGAGIALTKVSSLVYTVDLDLQAAADGSEIVHVNVVDNKSYDLVDLVVVSSNKTASLLATDLRLVGPISINVNSEQLFSATGGSGLGFVYSIVSGEGTIGGGNGIFFSGNNVGTAVIRVEDSYGNIEDVAVHVGGTAIYAVGGYNGGTMDDVEISFNGIDWKHYPDTDALTNHGESAMKVFKDKLWYVGGFSNSDDVFESSDGVSWVNNANVLPTGADWGNTAVFEGDLYYLGGVSGQFFSTSDGSNWSNVGGLYGGTDAGEAFAYAGRLWYVDGGTVVWTSDLVNWHEGTLTLPSARSYHAGTVFNDKMWLIGGNSNSTGNNVWWSVDGSDWHDGESTLPSPRDDGEVVTFNNRMWHVAGRTSGTATLSNLSSLDGITWETHANVMNVNRYRFAMEVFTDKTKGPTLATLTFENNSFADNDLRGVAYKESNTTLFVAAPGAGIQLTANQGSSWSSVTINDGLPSDNVTSVFLDRDGNLWAATDTGIGKSTDNGGTWTNYSTLDGLASNNTFEVVVDRANNIYVTTDIGLSVSTDDGTSWTTYDTSSGLASNIISDLHVDFNYKIYAATASGLSISSDNGTSWTTYTTASGLGSNSVNQVTTSSHGLLYAATDGGLAISVDNGATWRNYNSDFSLPTDQISGVYVDNYGIIYLSTPASGVIISKDGGTSWTTFTTTEGLGTNSPRHITVSTLGRIYVSTTGGVGIDIP